MNRALFISLLALSIGGCSNTTGSALVRFTARAAGPADATSGPLTFDTGAGYHVTLTRAKLHIGAVYLNMTKVASGGPLLPCVLPGIYVGEAFGACDPKTNVCGVDVDLLSPTLQPFPIPGQGTANPVIQASIWFTGGDINAPPDDPISNTVILDVAGTATQGAQSWPFVGTVTIGANRATQPPNAAEPGANPICQKRLIDPPICLNPIVNDAGKPDCTAAFTLSDGGTLDLRADPRAMFDGLVFSSLQSPTGTPPVFTIPDTNGGIGEQLYKAVIANSGVYTFTWTDKAQ